MSRGKFTQCTFVTCRRNNTSYSCPGGRFGSGYPPPLPVGNHRHPLSVVLQVHSRLRRRGVDTSAVSVALCRDDVDSYPPCLRYLLQEVDLLPGMFLSCFFVVVVVVITVEFCVYFALFSLRLHAVLFWLYGHAPREPLTPVCQRNPRTNVRAKEAVCGSL